jgi:xylan 1,4-beta-xylosidase
VQHAETFQWIETLTGELTLMSLETDRCLRVDFAGGKLQGDSPGPEPDGPAGIRFI